jgi:hypothetical protein
MMVSACLFDRVCSPGHRCMPSATTSPRPAPRGRVWLRPPKTGRAARQSWFLVFCTKHSDTARKSGRACIGGARARARGPPCRHVFLHDNITSAPHSPTKNRSRAVVKLRRAFAHRFPSMHATETEPILIARAKRASGPARPGTARPESRACPPRGYSAAAATWMPPPSTPNQPLHPATYPEHAAAPTACNRGGPAGGPAAAAGWRC